MEKWEEDLQKNLLQKAISTEFGYPITPEELIEKARGYPEGYVQMWGKTPYVKHNGKFVRQSTLQGGGGEKEATKLEWIKEGEDYSASYKNSKLTIQPSGTGQFILVVNGTAHVQGTLATCKGHAQDLIKKFEKMQVKKDPFTDKPAELVENKKELEGNLKFAGFVQINDARDQEIVVKDKEGKYRRASLDAEDNKKFKTAVAGGVTQEERDAMIKKYFGGKKENSEDDKAREVKRSKLNDLIKTKKDIENWMNSRTHPSQYAVWTEVANARSKEWGQKEKELKEVNEGIEKLVEVSRFSTEYTNKINDLLYNSPKGAFMYGRPEDAPTPKLNPTKKE